MSSTLTAAAQNLEAILSRSKNISPKLKQESDSFDVFRASANGQQIPLQDASFPLIDPQRASQARGIGTNLATTMGYQAKILAEFIDTVIANDGALGVDVENPRLDPIGRYPQEQHSFEIDGYNFEKLDSVATSGDNGVEFTNYSMRKDESGLDLVVEKESGKATLINFGAGKPGALRIEANSLDEIPNKEVEFSKD